MSNTNMLPVQVKPPQPPKPTKRDIIEAMATVIIEERQKKNAALQKQIDKIEATIKRKSIKHLRRAFAATGVKVTTSNGYDSVAKCYPRCVKREVIVKFSDIPELKELGDQLTTLEGQFECWGAKQTIMKELAGRTADRSIIVNGLLGKFRKELLEQAKAMLKSPTSTDKATAITV